MEITELKRDNKEKDIEIKHLKELLNKYKRDKLDES